MKKDIILFATLLLLAHLTGSCQHRELPEATAAAKAVYEQYADREGLTVALVGDYHTDRGTYTALMMQADDDSTWQQLLDELGLDYHRQAMAHVEFDSLPLNSLKVTSLAEGFATSAVTDSAGHLLDSLPIPDHVRQLVLDALGDKKLSGSMTITRTEKYKDDSLVASQTDTTHTVDSAHVRRMLSDSSLIRTANRSGDRGYIDYCDYDSRTLWLFFFRTAQELHDIMEHVVNNGLSSKE